MTLVTMVTAVFVTAELLIILICCFAGVFDLYILGRMCTYVLDIVRYIIAYYINYTSDLLFPSALNRHVSRNGGMNFIETSILTVK